MDASTQNGKGTGSSCFAGVNAPRDPRARGSRIYLLYRTEIEASPRADGAQADEIYLDMGRLQEKLRLMNALDEAALARLSTVEGLREMVAAIGISLEDAKAESVEAEVLFYGNASRYDSGTRWRGCCAADGSETLLWLAELAWTGDDAALGEIRFCFPREGMTARATVVLYAKENYVFEEPVLEPPVCFEGAAYQAVLNRSLLSLGTDGRLRQALARGRAGETLTLAFLGGSITQGAGAKPVHEACYARRTWRGLQALLGNESLRYCKAGIGGTSSELGMVRFERDVLDAGAPDVLVVEFAVNDADDETQGRCYESLVRKALSLPKPPAVVLLFSVFSNDWNLQERLEPIGAYYGLPMVSVRDAVCPQFGKTRQDGGMISKRQFFYDAFHPSNEGHRVMADCLLRLFASALAQPVASMLPLPADTLMGRTFESVRLLDRAHFWASAQIQAGGFSAQDSELQCVERDAAFHPTPQFPDNWAHTPTQGPEPFALTLRCKSLFVLTKDSGSAQAGRAQVYLDGQLRRVIDPHLANWTHCNAIQVQESDAPREHRVLVRMAPEDAQKSFTILGFGVC